jgi:hypothetical protein
MALIASLSEQVATLSATPKPRAKREPKPKLAYRICNPEKTCVVGTPLRATEYAKGKTFATWLDNDAKRRAYDGVTFLVVDTRGIAKADILEIAKAWGKGKKLTSRELTGEQTRDNAPAVAVPCYVFTKAGK